MKFSNFLLAFVFVLGCSSVWAQANSHYWSHQYGARGLLLNGSIIASVDDETAIFYNPGNMAMTDEFGISLSLITPTYSSLKTSDFLGENTSFVNQGLDLSPGLVAAMLKPFGTDKITLGLTTFKRFKAGINVEDRIVKVVDQNADQIFLGDLDFRRRLSENWFGVGLSFRVSDNFGIGVTQFITFRSEQVLLNFRKEIIDRQNPANLIAGWRSNFDYGYSANGGVLSKFGFCWHTGKFKIGGTVTTSTYALVYRRANYSFDDQKINFQGTNTASSNDRQVDLSNYQTPWSFGLGVEIPVAGSTLSISSEFFTEVPRYNLVSDIDDPLDGLGGVSEFTSVTISQANNKVLNVGIGIERTWKEKYTWFYGFRTDFSPRSIFDLGEGVSFLASTPNVYHISTGGAYLYRKSQFSVGLDFGFGFKSGGKQLTDISNITEDNIFTFSGDDSVDTAITQLSLYVTYDL